MIWGLELCYHPPERVYVCFWQAEEGIITQDHPNPMLGNKTIYRLSASQGDAPRGEAPPNANLPLTVSYVMF